MSIVAKGSFADKGKRWGRERAEIARKGRKERDVSEMGKKASQLSRKYCKKERKERKKEMLFIICLYLCAVNISFV